MSAFCFGRIQKALLGAEDSRKRKKRRKPPTGKLQKVYYKAKTMVHRRLLYVIYTFLFIFGVCFIRLAYKKFEIEFEGLIKINVLSVLVEQIKILFFIRPVPEAIGPEL